MSQLPSDERFSSSSYAMSEPVVAHNQSFGIMDIFLESRFDQSFFDIKVDAKRQCFLASKNRAPVKKNRLRP